MAQQQKWCVCVCTLVCVVLFVRFKMESVNRRCESYENSLKAVYCPEYSKKHH